MKPLFYSRSLERVICAYVKLIADLPLHAAALPPTFDHQIVLAAWKEGFAVAVAVANCSDWEAAVLSAFPDVDLGRLVEEHVTQSSWQVILRNCKHVSASEGMCARCKIEHGLARLAVIEEANLGPQDALGRDNDDCITLMFWKLMAEKGGCKKCHEKEYVACLCAFDNPITTKVQKLLLQWREKNAGLHIDLHFRGANYLDFVLRHVKHETCLACRKDYQNIILPPHKRLCFCKHTARVQCISDVLCNNLSDQMLAEPLLSVYKMIREMVKSFKFNVVKDGELVVQD